jgi:hypothetical protein
MSQTVGVDSMADAVALGIDVSIDGTGGVVSVRGDIDMATAPLLDGLLTAVIGYGCTRVAIAPRSRSTLTSPERSNQPPTTTTSSPTPSTNDALNSAATIPSPTETTDRPNGGDTGVP